MDKLDMAPSLMIDPKSSAAKNLKELFWRDACHGWTKYRRSMSIVLMNVDFWCLGTLFSLFARPSKWQIMASEMFASASSRVFPSLKQPGRRGTETENPPSGSGWNTASYWSTFLVLLIRPLYILFDSPYIPFGFVLTPRSNDAERNKFPENLNVPATLKLLCNFLRGEGTGTSRHPVPRGPLWGCGKFCLA